MTGRREGAVLNAGRQRRRDRRAGGVSSDRSPSGARKGCAGKGRLFVAVGKLFFAETRTWCGDDAIEGTVAVAHFPGRRFSNYLMNNNKN